MMNNKIVEMILEEARITEDFLMEVFSCTPLKNIELRRFDKNYRCFGLKTEWLFKKQVVLSIRRKSDYNVIKTEYSTTVEFLDILKNVLDKNLKHEKRRGSKKCLYQFLPGCPSRPKGAP